MADRGRLFYDSNGKLRQVDPAFVINGEPAEGDLEPVEFVAVTTDKLNNADFTTATAGQVFTKTATGNEAAFETVSTGAATLIEEQNPSGVATADFTTGIDSDHHVYIFYLTDIHPSSDAVLNLQVSDDGGSTWDSGASDYFWVYEEFDHGGPSESLNAANGDSKIELGGSIDSGVAQASLSGTVKLLNPSNGTYETRINYNLQWEDASDNQIHTAHGFGVRKTPQADDGVRFDLSAGNIDDGNIELIGVN